MGATTTREGKIENNAAPSLHSHGRAERGTLPSVQRALLTCGVQYGGAPLRCATQYGEHLRYATQYGEHPSGTPHSTGSTPQVRHTVRGAPLTRRRLDPGRGVAPETSQLESTRRARRGPREGPKRGPKGARNGHGLLAGARLGALRGERQCTWGLAYSPSRGVDSVLWVHRRAHCATCGCGRGRCSSSSGRQRRGLPWEGGAAAAGRGDGDGRRGGGTKGPGRAGSLEERGRELAWGETREACSSRIDASAHCRSPLPAVFQPRPKGYPFPCGGAAEFTGEQLVLVPRTRLRPAGS